MNSNPVSGRPLDLMSLESYRFHLPPERIAQKAWEPRDESRLLVLRRGTGEIEHRRFLDLPEFFDERDLMVANNTAVMRARLLGQRLLPDGSLGGKIEMLLLEKKGDRIWERSLSFECEADSGAPISGCGLLMEVLSMGS